MSATTELLREQIDTLEKELLVLKQNKQPTEAVNKRLVELRKQYLSSTQALNEVTKVLLKD